MAIGFTLIIISVLVIGIWVIIEVKRMKHKIFAVLLIALILFSYGSSSFVFKGHDIKWNTIPGIIEGGSLYFSWLGGVFTNIKSTTSYAIGMDWKGNEPKEDTKNFKDFFKFNEE